MNDIWVRALAVPMHLVLRPFVHHILILGSRSPVPILTFIISSGSEKKEPRCACLSAAKVSHSQC
jgi:hypothetical protein